MNNKIYECISIENVINKLNLKITNRIGTNIYINCPFCQKNIEKNGYMKINKNNNLYFCNNCESSGTSIELYSKLNHITTKQAFKELAKQNPKLDANIYVLNNDIKDETNRDRVYKAFLNLLPLYEHHKKKLMDFGFDENYIKTHQFKSIENNPINKKQICNELQKRGFELKGISGFFQDKDFKWTYKSHDGIFIPVIFNNKIQGLRINLDTEYRFDTKNIWFSSNNKYNGTKAINWPILLIDNKANLLEVFNSNTKKEIIMTTEIIDAHKLFNSKRKIILGVPNSINKNLLIDIINRLNVEEVILYADTYTLLHASSSMYRNIIKLLENQGIKVVLKYFVEEQIISNSINEFVKDKIA